MNKYDKYIPIKDFDPRAYPNCQKVFFLLKNTDASFTGFIYSKNSHYYVKMAFSGNDYDLSGDRITYIMAVSKKSVRMLQPLLFNW